MLRIQDVAVVTDLYDYDEDCVGKYQGYLMCQQGIMDSIPQKDIDYLRQVYPNEHGSKPHVE